MYNFIIIMLKRITKENWQWIQAAWESKHFRTLQIYVHFAKKKKKIRIEKQENNEVNIVENWVVFVVVVAILCVSQRMVGTK